MWRMWKKIWLQGEFKEAHKKMHQLEDHLKQSRKDNLVPRNTQESIQDQGPDSIGKKSSWKSSGAPCHKVATKNSRDERKSVVGTCLLFKLGFREDFHEDFFPIESGPRAPILRSPPIVAPSIWHRVRERSVGPSKTQPLRRRTTLR